MTSGLWPRVSSRPPWFGSAWVAVVVAVSFWQPLQYKDWLSALAVGGLGIVMAVLWTLLEWVRHRLFAVEVFDGGDRLGLRLGVFKDVLPLSEIESIDRFRSWRQDVITLRLKSPCRFGRQIRFKVADSSPFTRLPQIAEGFGQKITGDTSEHRSFPGSPHPPPQ